MCSSPREDELAKSPTFHIKHKQGGAKSVYSYEYTKHSVLLFMNQLSYYFPYKQL